MLICNQFDAIRFFYVLIYIETSGGCMVSSNSTRTKFFQAHLLSEILKNAGVLYNDNGDSFYAFDFA